MTTEWDENFIDAAMEDKPIHKITKSEMVGNCLHISYEYTDGTTGFAILGPRTLKAMNLSPLPRL